MKKVWDDRLFPIVISILLAWSLVGEYRDHGWEGVIIIIVAASIIFAILEVGIEVLAARGRKEEN